MLKPVIAATAFFALAGTSLVYAQQGFGGHGNSGGDGPRFEQRHRPNPADISAFTDARIAALKAGLELTPDQAKNWPPFEQALRDMAQLRIAAHAGPSCPASSRRRPRHSIGWNVAPTPWPKAARRSRRSPMPARRFIKASMTTRRPAS